MSLYKVTTKDGFTRFSSDLEALPLHESFTDIESLEEIQQ